MSVHSCNRKERMSVKVFLSQPMKDKSEEGILREREKIT